jgi:hypothetical protein
MSIAPQNPDQAGLDEWTAALSVAAMHVSNTILQGKKLRTRDMALRSASGVVSNLLRTMEYPRDLGLLPQLAWLAQQLTEVLDHIVLNAEPDDERLQALRTLAESAVTWPLLVRPGDEKLTALKIEKLKVGHKSPFGSSGDPGRRSSLGTPRNRLALRLVARIQNRTECILLVKRNGGAAQRCNTREAREHLRVIEPGIPEKDHMRSLKLLREARDNPFSAKNLKIWNRLLTEFVLIVDPELKLFPELKQVKSAKGGKYIKTKEAIYRTELEKFFHPALKNLLK